MGAVTLMMTPPIKRLARTLIIVALVWSIDIIAFSFTSTLWAAALAWVINIATVAWWANTPRTMFQLAAKDEMRGRVMGVRMLAVYGLPVGLVVGGWLIERYGVQAAITGFAVGGLIATGLAAIRWPSLLTGFTRPERE